MKTSICSKIDTRAFLRWIDVCNTHDLSQFVNFVVEDVVLGAVHKHHLPLLEAQPHIFQMHSDYVALHPRLDTPQARTQALDLLLRQWREVGILSGWREELYRVSTTFDAPPSMSIERSAASFFGIIKYGVHMNCITRRQGQIYFWIARRSYQKPRFPGKLDHLVAGGIPANLGVMDVAVKECLEEANIPQSLARHAQPVGAVSYCMAANYKLDRDFIFILDLELPSTFEPENTDGEVEAFYLWPLEKVVETVATTDAFKTNCNLVIIDYLVRCGYLDPDGPYYTEVVRRLRSPLALKEQEV